MIINPILVGARWDEGSIYAGRRNVTDCVPADAAAIVADRDMIVAVTADGRIVPLCDETLTPNMISKVQQRLLDKAQQEEVGARNTDSKVRRVQRSVFHRGRSESRSSSRQGKMVWLRGLASWHRQNAQSCRDLLDVMMAWQESASKAGQGSTSDDGATSGDAVEEGEVDSGAESVVGAGWKPSPVPRTSAPQSASRADAGGVAPADATGSGSDGAEELPTLASLREQSPHPVRTCKHNTPGGIHLDLDLSACTAYICVSKDTTAAEVHLLAADEESFAAVRDAAVRSDNFSLRVNVFPASASTLVPRNVQTSPPSGVRVLAVLPEGSTVAVAATACGVIVRGAVVNVRCSGHGSVYDIERADQAMVKLVSGSVALEQAGHAEVTAQAADVYLNAVREVDAFVRGGSVAVADLGVRGRLDCGQAQVVVHTSDGEGVSLEGVVSGGTLSLSSGSDVGMDVNGLDVHL